MNQMQFQGTMQNSRDSFLLAEAVAVESFDYMGEEGMGGDMYSEVGMESGTTSGNTPLASWLFVGGITALSLAISVVIGVFLAKKRIKKGFDLYED